MAFSFRVLQITLAAAVVSLLATTLARAPTTSTISGRVVDSGGATVWKTAVAPEIQVAATQTVGGDVPATMSLTLGAPASFGAFMPGVARDYTASTTATTVSSAGNATLSVSDRERRVQADDPGRRAAAHGHVRQAADVHAVDDAAVTAPARARKAA